MENKIEFLPQEKWKLINSLEGANNKHYSISNKGRLIAYTKTVQDGTLLQIKELDAGYFGNRIKIRKRKGAKAVYIHKAIAECFLTGKGDQRYVIHKDYNKQNNKVENIKWANRKERDEHFANRPVEKDISKRKFKWLPDEEFREIKSLSGMAARRNYAVSNYGRVMSYTDNISAGMLLTISIEASGYPVVSFSFVNKGIIKAKNLMLSRAVAECFLPPPEKNQIDVIHKDFDLHNNTPHNLQWATRKESLNRFAHYYHPRKPKKKFKVFVNEQFKPVRSLEGIGKLHYMISNLGRLASYNKSFDEDAKLVKGSVSKGQRFKMFDFIKDRKQIKPNKFFYYHRLVAECFLPPPAKDQIYLIHTDRDKLNNQPHNLKWVTEAQLQQHAHSGDKWAEFQKRNKAKFGTGKKLTESKVRMIKRTLARPVQKTRTLMIAKQFGVSVTTIRAIRIGKIWKQVEP